MSPTARFATLTINTSVACVDTVTRDDDLRPKQRHDTVNRAAIDDEAERDGGKPRTIRIDGVAARIEQRRHEQLSGRHVITCAGSGSIASVVRCRVVLR